MMDESLIDMIRSKARRLQTVPDKFLSGVRKSEKEVYEAVIELLSRMEVKSGQFVASRANLEIAGEVNELLRSVMAQGEYGKALSQFAKEFDIQADATLSYFGEAFQITTAPEAAAAFVAMAKRNAVDLLINRAADAEFLYPVRDIIEQSVVNNAGYAETLRSLREFIETSEDADGRLLSYSRGIAHDSFAVADRSTVSAYAAEYGMEWYLYLGGEIETTRPFCAERVGGYYHQKEIEKWGDGIATLGMAWPKKGAWGGEMDGTNSSTIFSVAGGYNCRHVISPVSEFSVPASWMERARAQGLVE